MNDKNKFFRANAHLIGKLVSIESLRYTSNNTAMLIANFDIPNNKDCYAISVRIKGNIAEDISRTSPTGQWFELNGDLFVNNNEQAEITSPVFVSTDFLQKIPNAEVGMLSCEVIGRLTKIPEIISKTNDFEFGRFSLAVNRDLTVKAHYFNFSVFKPYLLNEVMESLRKGESIFARGDLAFFKTGQEQRLTFSIKLERYIKLQENG